MTNKDLKYARYLIIKEDFSVEEIYQTIRYLKFRNEKEDDYRVYFIIAKLYEKIKEYELAKLNFLKAYVLSENNNIFNQLYLTSVLENNFEMAKYYLDKTTLLDNEKILNKYLLEQILEPENISKYSFIYDNYELFDKDSEYNELNFTIESFIKSKNYSKLKDILIKIKNNNQNNNQGNLNNLSLKTLIILLTKISELIPSCKQLALLTDEYVEDENILLAQNCLDLLASIENPEYKKFIEIEQNKIKELKYMDEFFKNNSDDLEKFNKCKELIRNKNSEDAILMLNELISVNNLNIYKYYIGKAYYKIGNYKLSKLNLEEYINNGGIKYEKALLYLYIINKNINKTKQAKKYANKLIYIDTMLCRDIFINTNNHRKERIDYYDRKPKSLLKTINITEEEFMNNRN